MDKTSRDCWKGILLCLIFHGVFFRAAYGGDFLYLPFPSGSRPNNTVGQELCKALGDYDLAIIDSQSEYDRMYAYFNQTLGPGFVLPAAVWMGSYWIQDPVYLNYTHYWNYAGCSRVMAWAYWDSGEPNGQYYELCTRIHTNMRMRSIQCSGAYDVLCEGIDTSGPTKCATVTDPGDEEVCELFAPCWWTPAKVGLTAGFTSLTVFFCFCCIGWKCFCAPKNQVGYDLDEEEVEEIKKQNGHDITKNHDIEHTPSVPNNPSSGFNSLVLNGNNSWMTPQELSFSARYGYKE